MGSDIRELRTVSLSGVHGWTSYTETAYGTKLLVAEYEDKTSVVFYSLYEGYEIEFDLLNLNGMELTQEQIDSCVKFLSDLDFVFAEKK